ncbi:MAG TPA: pyridoxal-phosphate dependent enzyme [Terriglobales bacterium]|nr:pyridoxal-phosphate dependent enzyme [Terriglobales bacterium]
MLVTLEQAHAAQKAIAGTAIRTPLVRLQADTATEVHLKLENLQPIGSFKIRGAANVMANTPAADLASGVVTASAGNMAQGVAFCARARSIPATVIAPDTAPATKLQAIARLGGRVIQVPFAEWWQCFETRQFPGITARFIHAFDDPYVIAGNATIALEICEDLPAPAAVVIPWGGGGLACGIASLLRQISPRTRIYAAEAETAAPLAAAWEAGEPKEVNYTPSFVDGIGSRRVFQSMLDKARPLLDGVIVVSLAEAAAAMQLAAERNRVVLEGAAACAVAAAISGRAGAGPVIAIASGGNIDLAKFSELTSGGKARPGSV